MNVQYLSSKWQKQNLLQLKEDKFTLKNQAEKDLLALQLLHCLTTPDPEIRDGYEYIPHTKW